jgi:hypothetical protein
VSRSHACFIQETSILSTWNIIHIGFHPLITSVHLLPDTIELIIYI